MSWTEDDVWLVQQMEKDGIVFTIRDGRIWAKPANKVGIREQAWITERKAALLELLEVRRQWNEIAR